MPPWLKILKERVHLFCAGKVSSAVTKPIDDWTDKEHKKDPKWNKKLSSLQSPLLIKQYIIKSFLLQHFIGMSFLTKLIPCLPPLSNFNINNITLQTRFSHWSQLENVLNSKSVHISFGKEYYINYFLCWYIIVTLNCFTL